MSGKKITKDEKRVLMMCDVTREVIQVLFVNWHLHTFVR